MKADKHDSPAGFETNDAGTADRSLIDQLPDALVVYAGSEIVFANAKAFELFGAKSATELLGRPVGDLVHAEDRERILSDDQSTAAKDDKPSPVGTLRFVGLKGGAPFHAEARVSPVLWKGRQARMVIVRPRPDTADTASFFHERLIAFADNAPFTFTLKDLHGHYLAGNREFLRATGKRLDDIIGKTAGEFYSSAEVAEQMEEMDRRLLDTGRPVTIEYELNESDYVARGYRELTKFPIYSDTGEIMAVGAVGIDTTRRRQSEVELLHRENFLSAILESTVDGIITIAQGGAIETMNRSAQEMFGYAMDDIVGQPLARLMADSDGGQHKDFFENCLRAGAPNYARIRREVTGRKSDGTEFPVELAIAEIVGMDGVRGFVGALRDLTERKTLENQLHHAQKMESLGKLTGGIAHDFNNLLTVVAINSRLLLQKLDDATQQEMLGSISRAAEHGATLVKQLLAYSRQTPLRPEMLDVTKVIEDMRGLLARTLPGNIRLAFELTGRLPPIKVDRTQLETALLNIVLNARDAMPGGGTLTIEATEITSDAAARSVDGPQLAGGHYVVFAISDNGVGIPDPEIGQVFDPFFTTKEVGQGSGLGLSMVYGFAHQSGGDVTIVSSVGGGTMVKLFLPAADSDAV